MKFASPLTAVVLAAIALAACGDERPPSDAFGNFEATETVVSAEATGRLLEFRAREGERLAAGAVVATIDTTQLVLRRQSLAANRAAAASKIESVRAQIGVLEEKLRIAARERERFRRLVQQDAAPRKQLDEAVDQMRVLEREMTTVGTQADVIRSEMASFDAQIAQINDQIARSVVVNPIEGVVLATYAEPHELAATGTPLYEIANLQSLYLKAYVSGRQLPSVQLGQEVVVVVDEADGSLREIPGEISWIASEAEFTPKLIQTREDRVNLVYAVRIRVPNTDGRLKIGMPGEVVVLRNE